MNLYDEKGSSFAPKLVVWLLEIGLIILSGWILFGEGERWLASVFSWDIPDEIPARRYVIIGFSVIIFLRMAFMMAVLMKRKLPWSEAFTVPFAFALYYIGFAVLVLPSHAPLGMLDWFGIILFGIGCALNSWSEWQRHVFKRHTSNNGKLYTSGLFGLSMHINFFGDIVWIAAYALISQNIWSVLIVVMILLFFALFNVPMLDRYLAERYGVDFVAYAARTKKLVPYIW